MRVVLLLGAVLSLSGADGATVGAVAPQLQDALHVGNAGIGLLSSAALIAAGLFLLRALRTYRQDVAAVTVPPRS